MPTIRELREAKNWSQEDLASRARVSLQTIYRLEKGESVTRATITLVAMALEVQTDQITGVNVLDRGKQ